MVHELDGALALSFFTMTWLPLHQLQPLRRLGHSTGSSTSTALACPMHMDRVGRQPRLARLSVARLPVRACPMHMHRVRLQPRIVRLLLQCCRPRPVCLRRPPRPSSACGLPLGRVHGLACWCVFRAAPRCWLFCCGGFSDTSAACHTSPSYAQQEWHLQASPAHGWYRRMACGLCCSC